MYIMLLKVIYIFKGDLIWLQVIWIKNIFLKTCLESELIKTYYTFDARWILQVLKKLFELENRFTNKCQ